jgi:hypothetical protein
MAVLKEFACKAHGPFEEFTSDDEMPRCPHGCSAKWVVREIRTAPAGKSVVTGTMDRIQRDFADQHKLPDIRVDKDSDKSVMDNLRRGEKPSDFGSYWGKNVNIKDFQPTNALQMAGNLPQPTPSILDGRHTGPLPEVP